jgi:hypothetical protein
MNELQLTIAELKIEYAEQKLPEADVLSHVEYGYESEELLFTKVLSGMESYGIEYHAHLITHRMSKAQRQRFFQYMSTWNHYDIDDASERQYMVNAKIKIYRI